MICHSSVVSIWLKHRVIFLYWPAIFLNIPDNLSMSYLIQVSINSRLNYLMAGLSPMWYHATNVALHAAACILVTRVSLVVAALRPGFAALAGLLFAAHPVHTEAVSGENIPGRHKNILSGTIPTLQSNFTRPKESTILQFRLFTVS